MKRRDDKLWEGLDAHVQKLLSTRDYQDGSLAERLGGSGVEARNLVGADRTQADLGNAWIPGVEIFAREVHAQRYRGVFGELARRDDGILAQIGLWPVQWATARMFGNTAKGFHVHPPSIPEGEKAETWLHKLFVDEPENYRARPYDREQWDVIFFVQGVAEMILRDARAGMAPRVMRFFVDGDNRRSANNVGVIIPPGVAHAIRVEGSEDAIMVYGTSTTFRPEFEGRVASEIETALLPESWQKFLNQT
jgi:dTDP-4-dehydrorhamnose 3,5-epimerase-like enzyme